MTTEKYLLKGHINTQHRHDQSRHWPRRELDYNQIETETVPVDLDILHQPSQIQNNPAPQNTLPLNINGFNHYNMNIQSDSSNNLNQFHGKGSEEDYLHHTDNKSLHKVPSLTQNNPVPQNPIFHTNNNFNQHNNSKILDHFKDSEEDHLRPKGKIILDKLPPKEPYNLITIDTRVRVERKKTNNNTLVHASSEVKTHQVSYFTKQSPDNHDNSNTRTKNDLHSKELRVILNGLKCSKCPFVTTCLNQFKSHETNATHNYKVKFKCSICNRNFNQKSNLQAHIQKVHEQNFKCSLCDKHFFRKDNLQVHLIGVHQKVKKYECTACQIKFATPTGEMSHRANVHGLRLWKCELCPLTYKKKFNLRQHCIREHCVDIAADIVCLLCDQFFPNRVELFSHKTEVHKQKSWECNQCGKVFGRKDYMKNHFEAVHMNTKFKCSYCTSKFSYNAGLFSHIQKFHND
jgi:KRAB domain-containing zinc finger protein